MLKLMTCGERSFIEGEEYEFSVGSIYNYESKVQIRLAFEYLGHFEITKSELQVSNGMYLFFTMKAMMDFTTTSEPSHLFSLAFSPKISGIEVAEQNFKNQYRVFADQYL